MAKVTFDGQTYESAGATVLDTLTGHGVSVPSSCRSGVCQTCLMQAVKGTPPPVAQKGLKETLKAQNYFLACVCEPAEDLEVVLPGSAEEVMDALVESLTPLSEDIVGVRLVLPTDYAYKPGQFLNLYRDDGLVRSYSIASLPDEDAFVELHVRRIASGKMSEWVHSQLHTGDEVQVSAAHGDCFYMPGKPEQPLLLIGTGSGLAPLYGIARDALAQGHTGPVCLFHGSHDHRGLYLMDELRDLAARYKNFHYVPCISGTEDLEGVEHGRASDVALQRFSDLKGMRLFLCGHPDMVSVTKRKAFLAGASLGDILADPFSFARPAAQVVQAKAG